VLCVNRRINDFSMTWQLNLLIQLKLNVTGHGLMKKIRGCIYVAGPVDDFMPLTVVGYQNVIMVREFHCRIVGRR